MTNELLPDDEPQFEEDLDAGADADAGEDWDEETLGLDWNEADAQNLVREVIPARGWAD
jgi:hypothetical protein